MKPNERTEIYTNICRRLWGLSGTFTDIYDELRHHGAVTNFDMEHGNWIQIHTVEYGEYFNLMCWLTGANIDGIREVYMVMDLDDPDEQV